MTKTNALFAFLILFAINSYAQIKFEKGSFIFNNGLKTDCLIKNVDWEYAPSKLVYKLTEDSDEKTIETTNIKEFQIDQFSKYIKARVKIDTSKTDLTNLSKKRSPEWSEEREIMLEVLIEGKASLYKYTSNALNVFFYKTENTEINQLIFKKYSTDNLNIRTNYRYRQQLTSDVYCEDISLTKINNLNYYKNELTKYFRSFNECHGQNFKDYERSKNRNFVNLNIRPGIDYTSVEIRHDRRSRLNSKFDSEIKWRLGAEFEFILPMKKNKWSITIEPTYTSFNSEKGTTSNGEQAIIDYSSLEFVFGLRHYAFFNDNSKLFFNAGALMGMNLSSELNQSGITLPIDKRFNYSSITFGLGYKYKRWSSELRFYTPKALIKYDYDWRDSLLKKTSFILGYQIF
ncbi:porin family protein [Aquimarina pacifica]|uniref:outer membrane beta-barrel protein n=1 Tax=Aquimarina pacifica TaxID=1296415 RepID=UPI0004722D07|nr:outer membrane beta-barrel protein [Aquimarina pacifica]